MKKLLFLLMIGLVVFTGCSVKKTSELTSAERFAVEFSVSKENPFEYATIEQVLEIFDHGTGIIFFGNSDCDWCCEDAKILTEALDDENVEKVYYYNPKSIMDKNTKEYQQLVEILKEYLNVDENGEAYLFLPDTYFVRNGKIIAHNNDMASFHEEVDTFTDEVKDSMKDRYLELIQKYHECTDDVC